VEEYQDVVDARDAAVAMRAVAAGTLQALSGDDADAHLAAATSLAFWRKHRGFTQAEMAQAIGVSQPYLAQLETGQSEGSVSVYQRLAQNLSVGEPLPNAEANP
jgi:DNA-binding XRE family transcriptional regulator